MDAASIPATEKTEMVFSPLGSGAWSTVTLYILSEPSSARITKSTGTSSVNVYVSPLTKGLEFT